MNHSFWVMTNHPLSPYTGGMEKKEKADRKKIGETSFFQIRIRGEVDQTRMDWFEKMGFKVLVSGSADGSTTILTGLVVDQAHLRGFLIKLWDLNFEVTEVRKLDALNTLGDRANE